MKYTLVLLLNVSLFFSCDAQKKNAPIFSTNAGAIEGYDPVAYFTQNKPVKGEATISYTLERCSLAFCVRVK